MNDLIDDDALAPSPTPSGSARFARGRLRGAISRLIPRVGAASADDGSCFGSLILEAEEDEEAGAASAILRQVLPDIYFVNTPAERAARHLEMLRRLRPAQHAPLLLFHGAPGRPLLECTLCAFDEDSPGLLAKLCGTIAGLDLSIHTAFIYTLRLGSGNALGPLPATAVEVGATKAGMEPLLLAPAWETGVGRPVVLNTFLVSESYFGHDRTLTLKTQRRLKAELCRVLRGQARVPLALARARRSTPPLQIHELQVENRPHEKQTRVLLRAGDTFGVLYRATAALAFLGLDITTAQVSTREEEADDLFFVTSNGQKLPDSALDATRARLRALLQNEA